MAGGGIVSEPKGRDGRTLEQRVEALEKNQELILRVIGIDDEPTEPKTLADLLMGEQRDKWLKRSRERDAERTEQRKAER